MKVCEDCGRLVSDLALACPQCARPVAAMKETVGSTAGSASVGAAPAPVGPVVELPASSPTARVDPLAQPAVHGGWLEGIRKERDRPARSIVCKRCDADVAFDTFRVKVGDAYLCSECVTEEVERREVRRVYFSKAMLVGGLLVVGIALTAGAIQLAPTLLAPHTTHPK